MLRRALLLIAVAALVAPACALAKPRYRVSVTRDSAGIPHIRAHDFGSLGYGEGYTFAQDNLCTFADDVMTLRGQRTRYFGAKGRAIGYANGTSDPNPKSDLFWTEVRKSGLVGRLARRDFSPRLRALYRGYAAGYNAWLRSKRFHDPRCKGKPWVKPITLRDLELRGYQIQIFASTGQFISGVVDAKPPTAPHATPAGAAPRPRLHALDERLGESTDTGLGSNGIGLGSHATRARDGMVLANPHFPWRGTERFWMAQLTVPGSYDVMGGTLMGFPPIGIGFNRHMAWTHTVSTSRRFVVVKLQLVPGDPTSYLVDGKPVRMTRRTVHAGGRTHTFYFTRYGRVFDLDEAGYTWTDSTAYALSDVNATSLRAGREYLAMGRARGVPALLRVERRYLAIPAFNTLAADDRGRALYADVGAVPGATKRLIANCTPPGLPQLVFKAARVVTLDGSRSACRLRTGRGAPARGMLGPRQLPATIRRDYVENSNDSYWLANPSHPFGAFSPIVGLIDEPQNLRTRLGNRMIQARLPHRGRGGFTVRRLERMWENDRSLAGELVNRRLVAACHAHPSVALADGSTVDLSKACAALTRYGGSGRLRDRGGWLFLTWQNLLPSGIPWDDKFDPRHPLTTPRVLDTGDPATLQALGEAVRELRRHHVRLDATIGDVQHATRHGRRYPIPSCPTCFASITSSHGRHRDGAPYGEVIFGSSLVMFTELTRHGPHSQGILTYSQATDPTSRWYANMTRRFSQRRFVRLRYTPRALRRDHGARTTVLRG